MFPQLFRVLILVLVSACAPPWFAACSDDEAPFGWYSAIGGSSGSTGSTGSTRNTRTSSGFKKAADYSGSLGGASLLVMRDKKTVFEDYPDSNSSSTAHRLASGTKSFWGVAAAAAVEDGLIGWDERVSNTLTSWKRDPNKSRITVRQLLNFTSGLSAATKQLRGSAQRDKFAFAVNEIPATDPAGQRFTYGPSHLTAFGAYLQRKLAAAGKKPDPLDYLVRRVLDPIGLKVERWNRDEAGNPIMAAGAYLTAREWAKFGQLVLQKGSWKGKRIVSAELMRELFKGSRANPAYGLTFWLNREPGLGPRRGGGRAGGKRTRADDADNRYAERRWDSSGESPVNGYEQYGRAERLLARADRLEARADAQGGARGERLAARAERLRTRADRLGANDRDPTADIGNDRAFADTPPNGQKKHIAGNALRDLVMAAGSGNQRLYIVPSLNLVVARQGKKAKGWLDEELLKLISDALR